MAHLGPHSEVMCRERELWAWDSAFIGLKGRGPRVSQVHSLFMNLKFKSEN